MKSPNYDENSLIPEHFYSETHRLEKVAAAFFGLFCKAKYKANSQAQGHRNKSLPTEKYYTRK
jgi:hypothetical protein